MFDPPRLTLDQDDNKKPYACAACGSRYGRADVLLRHRRTCRESQSQNLTASPPSSVSRYGQNDGPLEDGAACSNQPLPSDQSPAGDSQHGPVLLNPIDGKLALLWLKPSIGYHCDHHRERIVQHQKPGRASQPEPQPHRPSTSIAFSGNSSGLFRTSLGPANERHASLF